MSQRQLFLPASTRALLGDLERRRGASLRVGVVSDVHGQHKRPALELFCRESELDLLLCCGDLQDYRGYQAPIAPMIFVHGNHECWSVVDELIAGRRVPDNLRYLPDAIPIEVGGARVVGIGGCKSNSDKGLRKHLDPAALERLAGLRAEIVLSHDTPIVYSNTERERTVEQLRAVVQKMQPRFWFSGHHHYWATEQVGRTTIVSLGRWPDEWAVLEIARGQVTSFNRFVPRSDGFGKRRVGWRNDEDEEKAILFTLDRGQRRYGVSEPGVPAWR